MACFRLGYNFPTFVEYYVQHSQGLLDVVFREKSGNDITLDHGFKN